MHNWRMSYEVKPIVRAHFILAGNQAMYIFMFSSA